LQRLSYSRLSASPSDAIRARVSLFILSEHQWI
jgi:hypothetical protein